VVIDLHCHVLPGVDDGPADMDESVALARVAEAVGIHTLVATSHVSFDVRLTPEVVARGVAAVNARLEAEGVGVGVRPGGEVAVAYGMRLDDAQLAGLRLGGGPWLLAECPLERVATGFDSALRALAARGHRLVLAHPERSPAIRRDPAMLRALVGEGMLSSITAGSLVGRFGAEVREFALRLLEEGLVHNVTSDAHHAVRRPPGLRAALFAAAEELPGLEGQIDWLTVDVPAAVLAGRDVPPRPVDLPRRPQPRRGLLRRLVRPR
jgi:protein-tyrosine phosphatase